MEPVNLLKIDASLLQDHSCLDLTDHCYFFGEYSGKKGFNHSEMNQLIWNFDSIAALRLLAVLGP